MSDTTDIAPVISSTVIGVAVVLIAYRQWRTEQARLIHDRFEKRFAVYKATDDFIKTAYITGLTDQDVFDFYDVTKEAYFLFNRSLASYLEEQVLAKGSELNNIGKLSEITNDVEERREREQERTELITWMRKQRNPT
jgi:hypothetical protein